MGWRIRKRTKICWVIADIRLNERKINLEIRNVSSAVVKVGLCEYGNKEYRAFVCRSDIFPGTGDYEDEEKIREDRDISCFCVWFEDYAEPGSICAGGEYFLLLSEAIEYTEKSPGFKEWIS